MRIQPCIWIAFSLMASLPVPAQSTQRIAYGAESTSFGELTLPPGAGPFPIAVLLHGGCWRSDAGDISEMRPLAAMLSKLGIAAWNIEYRRVGHPGGGWPGTYHDLSAATDRVRELAKSHPLDLARVALIGHSSGGYFAAWLAGRSHLPASSEIAAKSPLKLSGMILLDAFLDPGVIDSRGTSGSYFCREPLLDRLYAGTPESRKQISPLQLLPFGIAQEYVVSSKRYPVTPPYPLADGRTTYPVADYPALARSAGDTISLQIVPDAGHMNFITPDTPAWTAVEAAIQRVFPR